MTPTAVAAATTTLRLVTDVALDLITRWCHGEVVTHEGGHYRSDGTQIAARPTQERRIPVWIGDWSRPALRRAARWDDWIVSAIDETQAVWFGPERVAEGLASLGEFGAPAIDVAVNGTTTAGEPGLTRELAEAGATWWFESLFGLRGSHSEMLERVTAGPPA